MNKWEEFRAKWNETYDKMQPGMEKSGAVCRKIGDVLSVIGLWAWRLRKIVFSIPVVWGAVYLAQLNGNVLPEMVGIGLQNSGEYVRYISRGGAVGGPLAVTAVCLLLMFCSRKTLFPWLISMFSLVLPLLLLLTNLFPA